MQLEGSIIQQSPGLRVRRRKNLESLVEEKAHEVICANPASYRF